MTTLLKQFAALALDTIFPIECLGCKAEGTWVCQRCCNRIKIKSEDDCLVCKKIAPGGKTCFDCRKEFNLDRVLSFLDYDDVLVGCLLRVVKYGYVKDALSPLLNTVEPHFLAKLDLLEIDPRALVFVPVPLHPRRLRDRGFNQAEIIAAHLAAVCGGQLALALTRRRHRPPQASLDEFDRARNIRHNIWCADLEAVRGKFVCLVDDVTTTGSTLDECGRALRKAQPREVWGIVLAKG